jgi:hypothetical protein
MSNLPFYIPAGFVFTTFLTIYLFYNASGKNLKLLMMLAIWMTIQSAVAATGFFTIENTIPPRFLLLLLPPLITILIVFSNVKGRLFVQSFNIEALTLLHSVRIAAEMVLLGLFLHKTMPQLMTFEGRNFDLLSGLTAPIVYYFGFVKKKLGKKAILAWNFTCLAILLFTVTNAVLSAPTPFQKFAFDQPTIAVLYFPFVWLPGVVVPLVIFSHLITIHSLLKQLRHKKISTASPNSKTSCVKYISISR